jgi:hypothetical protein
MRTAQVKTYSVEKSYGFILCDDGTDDCFFHKSAVKPRVSWREPAELSPTYDVNSGRRDGHPVPFYLQLSALYCLEFNVFRSVAPGDVSGVCQTNARTGGLAVIRRPFLLALIVVGPRRFWLPNPPMRRLRSRRANRMIHRSSVSRKASLPRS